MCLRIGGLTVITGLILANLRVDGFRKSASDTKAEQTGQALEGTESGTRRYAPDDGRLRHPITRERHHIDIMILYLSILPFDTTKGF